VNNFLAAFIAIVAIIGLLSAVNLKSAKYGNVVAVKQAIT
jgi:hypothetical protein